MAGSVEAEFFPLYTALAEKGVPPREADRLETWEVAAALGLDEQDSVLTGEALLQARWQAHQEGRKLTAADVLGL